MVSGKRTRTSTDKRTVQEYIRNETYVDGDHRGKHRFKGENSCGQSKLTSDSITRTKVNQREISGIEVYIV